jgi:hypothetical protein
MRGAVRPVAILRRSIAARGLSQRNSSGARARSDIDARGFDPEPLGFFGVSFETRMLYTYVKQKRLRVAPAFVRDTIEIILQKSREPKCCIPG